MKQSRAASLVESLTNVAVGFSLSLGLQAMVLPALGVPLPFAVNLVFAVVMTAVSIARSFLLRRVFEALHIRRPLSPAMLAVIAERFRQIEAEGWSLAHDDAHAPGELANAAACYGFYAHWHLTETPPAAAITPPEWPWNPNWWKPRDFRRDLVRAAALTLAEIEKFDRLKTAKTGGKR